MPTGGQHSWKAERTGSWRRLVDGHDNRLRPLIALLLVVAFLSTGIPVAAQQVQATEYQVKAAFLFNFGRYVTWPRPIETTFTICVLGRDPFGQTLDGIVTGEKIAARPAAIQRIRSVQEAATCQVVFIAGSEEPRLPATLGALAKLPVLTVSDIPHFVERGGIIQFVNDGNRVRFVVNLAAAQKAGLALSSELLKVAKSVQRDDTTGAM